VLLTLSFVVSRATGISLMQAAMFAEAQKKFGTDIEAMFVRALEIFQSKEGKSVMPPSPAVMHT